MRTVLHAHEKESSHMNDCTTVTTSDIALERQAYRKKQSIRSVLTSIASSLQLPWLAQGPGVVLLG